MASLDPQTTRRQLLGSAQRLVVKVGSRLLVGMPGVPVADRVAQLVEQIARVRARGLQVVLVSSGAIGTGMIVTGTAKRPRELAHLQALAAVGQSRLMSFYESACQQHGFHCAQMLLSADDVQDRQRHLLVRNCLNALLDANILPIINENDTVCVEEIRFGDNDTLAALVGTLSWANLTVLLTTVDGLRHRGPQGLGERVAVVPAITPEIRALAGGTDDQRFSTGGMTTKLRAAEICTTAGEVLVIANGHDFSVLDRILAGDDVGTLFLPVSPRLTGPKRYLAFFTAAAGDVLVDAGAVRALRRQGCSLLPSGITDVRGEFGRGDTVRVLAPGDEEIGMGIANFNATELRAVKGLRSPQVAATLGPRDYDEAIHRDNLVIWSSPRGKAAAARADGTT